MEASQSFQDHIHELRRRLVWVGLAIILSATIAYVARNQIIVLLQRPLHQTLFYSSPAGAFNFVLRFSMVVGMFITLPVIIYQLLRFVEPALPRRIPKSTFVKIIGSSFLLACLGVAFGYFYMIPTSLHFFGGYSTSEIKPLISADSYLTFVIDHLLTFALSFQIPLIVLFINKIKPMGPKKLLKYQRHVIVGSLVFALVLPFTYDPVSQFMVAVPIVFLYYLSVVLLWLTNRKSKNWLSETQPKPIYSPPVVQNGPVSNLIPEPRPDTPLIPQLHRPRMLAIDGFMQARPQVAYSNVSKPISTSVKLPVKPDGKPATTQRMLSIDGFVPINKPIDSQAS